MAEKYRTIVPSELNNRLKNKDFLLVGVNMFNIAEIPGTDMYVPFYAVVAKMGQFPQNKDAEIIVYCRDGILSNYAANKLQKFGYINVSQLGGGYMGWKREGLPLNDPE